MNCFEGIVEDLNSANFDFIEKNYKNLEDLNKLIADHYTRVSSIIEEFKETKILPDLTPIKNWETPVKENIEPKEPDNKEPSPPRTRRTRRNPLKESTENEAVRTTRSRNGVQVKTERPSTINEIPHTEDNAGVVVKTEMPAPSKPAPKSKKKRKESKVQVKKEVVRDSDVIVQDTTVTMINLVDSSEEGEKTVIIKQEKDVEDNKKKKLTKKRSRTHSSDEEKKDEKQEKKSRSYEFKDALSTLEEPRADATFVTQPQILNATVVVENPKLVRDLIPESVNDMITDDESEEEEKKKKSPPKPIRAIPKPVKPVFSPFAQSPVKQKVQAFEKLQEEANALPPRTTRTKTRALAKEQEAMRQEEETKSNVKEKAKLFTPVASKFLPKAASTTMKTSRLHSSASNENLLSGKSASALKASQNEFREREKKRREKEQEALKKREALIQAQIEEKKRKREEKQLKAQQQRELLEKDKMKVLEQQKLKDERHKRLIAEQEEKKQKQKEEMEKKRMMAKMRAIEEKKREEEKRLQEQKKQEELTAKLARQDEDMMKMLQKQKQKQVPIYLKTRAPLLPTQDCYDSDDEEHGTEKFTKPEWAKENSLRYNQRCAFAAGEAIKNTFFSIQVQTPDLQDIFEVIDPQKLKRSSSAVWHKPPRFTMVPQLEDHDETEEFDEMFE